MTKKTKIVVTIGPATESQEVLTKLVNSGMNIMRLNFSHGDFFEHQIRVNNLRKVIQKTGSHVGIIQDLGGPKIRIGKFKTDSVILKKGQIFTLTTENVIGNKNIVSVNYPFLPKVVRVGHIIFLHDGNKKLEVKEIKIDKVMCKVLVGGNMRGERGVNLPDSKLSTKSLTTKDVADMEFGLKNEVDYFALSFVRHPSDILYLRNILKKKKSKAKIIAKIETAQAIKHIDKIIRLSDAIMVARGDLATEVPFEKVPIYQKMIIKKCNKAKKFVITATGMMESMIDAPIPSRAEVSDVANAIIDGTDAIMLSKETTLGHYPIETLETVTKIALETEKYLKK
ncbi:MAG: pyruvate kinase [Candidatus Zambryskibacteria bacterium RIFOXYD1_FULL_40_13]|nr:MAG: Pyruvate kinase [Parcubacteria group bacterium GW2011_GWC1_39_12]KKR18948.1 MAG: Pyruvate kinase [Parcubacteria group bacterium GW2011_GWF1_39_37]KKR35575.1 MAG: Pyruvate kinase [Parcubacteria group bacterium GW2011_GWC2_40_10]KKR51986.1 MAG: Pyruvate kinase [Parcubacteria group bacterium GW2011_GWE1_40_20]KKR68487.1 MAG: Pyruvate kinase [Parcubacteria group bacterium GW2011_GWF2_40_69]KKR80298.1 MAG: Pyruvate kinase [Parcubacteria group bacterium GW2011_GWD1_40_9]KKS35898.1 MAG: Pyru